MIVSMSSDNSSDTVQFDSSRSSSRGRMVKHMFSNLLLLWSLSYGLYITGLTYDAPKVGKKLTSVAFSVINVNISGL